MKFKPNFNLGKLVYMFLILAFLPLQHILSQEYIDLSNASIVVSAGNSLQQNVAEFLQQEIASRSGISLQIKSNKPGDGRPSIVLGQANDYNPPNGLAVPSKRESYAIWTENQES
ncbi:hypothetical protein ACFLRQ_03490, partial [Bacteroidota bacterium]